MNLVDKFVVYDDVNYINKGWINRNNINVNGQKYMFTIPLVNSSQNKLICDINIDSGKNTGFNLNKITEEQYDWTLLYDSSELLDDAFFKTFYTSRHNFSHDTWLN